jgi:hypothetical protein
MIGVPPLCLNVLLVYSIQAMAVRAQPSLDSWNKLCIALQQYVLHWQALSYCWPKYNWSVLTLTISVASD